MQCNEPEQASELDAEGSLQHASSTDPALVFEEPALLERIARNLGPNEVTCLRLVGKASAEAFGAHVEVDLSQPVPPWAFARHWARPDACASLTRSQRRQLVSLAASDVANLEVALAATGLTPSQDKHVSWEDMLCAASGQGHRDIAEWCVQRNSFLKHMIYGTRKAAVDAARGGHFTLVDYLVSITRELVVYDLESEEVNIENGHALGMAAIESPADLRTVQQLVGQHADIASWDPDDFGSGLCAALRSGTDWAAKADWMLSKGALLQPYHYVAAMELAADGPARLTWLKGKGCPLDPRHPFLLSCVGQGNLPAFSWLLAQGLNLDTRMLVGESRQAARAGHVAMLQALETAGLRSDVQGVVAAAAFSGRLAVVKWACESASLHQAGRRAELTAQVFTAAPGSGSVELLRWLHARGCPMQPEPWAVALDSGAVTAVEALVELGCPMPADGEPYAVAALRWG